MLANGGNTKILGDSANHGRQLKIAIGYMNEQIAMRRQFLEIQFNGLLGNKVDGNGVRAKGINHNHVVGAVFRILHS